jgi:hypothetical protein
MLTVAWSTNEASTWKNTGSEEDVLVPLWTQNRVVDQASSEARRTMRDPSGQSYPIRIQEDLKVSVVHAKLRPGFRCWNTAHRTFYKRNAIILFFLTVFSSCTTPDFAKEPTVRTADPVIFPTPDANDIFFGPGVVFACKYIQLYRTGTQRESVEVYSQGKNFQSVRQWIIDNLYGKLNHERKIAAVGAEYHLLLSTLENRSMRDVLLIVPLNHEILGDNYLDKIKELRLTITKTEKASEE